MHFTTPKGLTPSQTRNLIALVTGGLLTLNEHWPWVTALVGQHYHGLPIPAGVTAALQLTALGVTSLSRALNRAKSGTGQGIVGAAPVADTPDAPPVVAALPALLTLLLPRLSGPQKQVIVANIARMVAEGEMATAQSMTQPMKQADLAPAPAAPPPAPVLDAPTVAVLVAVPVVPTVAAEDPAPPVIVAVPPVIATVLHADDAVMPPADAITLTGGSQ